MTKIAFALAAAVLAGTTMTNAANAGVRLGFGFPLGSFIAHSRRITAQTIIAVTIVPALCAAITRMMLRPGKLQRSSALRRLRLQTRRW